MKPKTTDQTVHSLRQVGSTAFTRRRINGVPFSGGTEVKVMAIGEVRAEWQSQRYHVGRADESPGSGLYWVYGDELVDEKPPSW